MTQTEEQQHQRSPASAMEALYSLRTDIQLSSLLSIKDEIIGHPRRKAEYLDINPLQQLLTVIRSPAITPEIRLQATIVLGSLCHGMRNLPPFSCSCC